MYIIIDNMRKPLRFIAAIMMSAAAMTSDPLFAQKRSVLDSAASVDYTVNRPHTILKQSQRVLLRTCRCRKINGRRLDR